MAGKGVTGMVLAGGRSRRLGRDKVVLPWDGSSLLARSVGLLTRVCDDVWVSGRDPSRAKGGKALPDVSAPWIADETPGIGPMGGIISCLRRIRTPLLVIACDLPLLDEATLLRLLAHWRTRPTNCVMTTFLQRDTGFIESLVAVYEPEALQHLEASRDRSVYKLSSALPCELRHEVPYGPDEARSFFNINRPEDLEALLSLRASREGEAKRSAPEAPCA